MRHGDLRIGDLAVARFAPELPHGLHQEQDAERAGMIVGEASAGGQRRQAEPSRDPEEGDFTTPVVSSARSE